MAFALAWCPNPSDSSTHGPSRRMPPAPPRGGWEPTLLAEESSPAGFAHAVGVEIPPPSHVLCSTPELLLKPRKALSGEPGTGREGWGGSGRTDAPAAACSSALRSRRALVKFSSFSWTSRASLSYLWTMTKSKTVTATAVRPSTCCKKLTLTSTVTYHSCVSIYVDLASTAGRIIAALSTADH